MSQDAIEWLSAHIETLGKLIERAEQCDVYDELLDGIEALVIDLIRSRLH